MAEGNNQEQKLDYIMRVVESLRLEIDQMKQDMAQLKLAQVGLEPHLPLPVGLKGLPPPPYSSLKARECMSEQEIKDIQRRCTFRVVYKEDPRYQSMPPFSSSAPVFINRYNQVEIPSTFMDLTKGVFTTPVRGRYEFTFWLTIWGEGRIKVAVVCGEKRKEFEQDAPRRIKVKLIKSVKEDCDAGTEVSLELTRLCGEIVRVTKCRFMGEMTK